MIWSIISYSYPIFHRSDLSAKLGPTICQGVSGGLAREKLWQYGIYDTFINAQVIRGKGGPLSTTAIQQYALNLAKLNNHRGLGFGHCSDQSSWVASVPNPTPLVQRRGPILRLDISSLNGFCRRVSLHFAARKGGLSKRVWSVPSYKLRGPFTHPVINPYFLPEGNLSISCLPKQARSGWELLALIPLNGNIRTPPFLDAMEQEGLMSWINRVRSYHQLPPAKTDSKALLLSSQRLLKTGTVHHDRQQLKQEKRRLLHANMTFLGENRVMGRDKKDMAWLLWNSPRHRNLLLSEKATHLGLAFKQSSPDTLAVIVMARANKL